MVRCTYTDERCSRTDANDTDQQNATKVQENMSEDEVDWPVRESGDGSGEGSTRDSEASASVMVYQSSLKRKALGWECKRWLGGLPPCKSPKVRLGDARLLQAAPTVFRALLEAAVSRYLLGKARSSARRTLAIGAALQECSAAMRDSPGPPEATLVTVEVQRFVQALANDHIGRLENLMTAVSACAVGNAKMPRGETQMMAEIPEIQQLGLWAMLVGEDSEPEDDEDEEEEGPESMAPLVDKTGGIVDFRG